MPRLDLCPFCQGAELVVTGWFCRRVTCRSCGAHGPLTPAGNTDPVLAAALWNRRRQRQGHAGAVAVLKPRAWR